MVHMPDGHARTRAFEQISYELLRAPGEQPTLQRITELAVETITRSDECGVSILCRGHSVATPACTSPLVREADELQYQLNQGPGLEAIWQLDTCLIEDLGTDQRWPGWAPAAVELGFRSILSVRLDTPEDVLGSLNLYARVPRAFDNSDLMIASIFARHAANALLVSRDHDGLRVALRSRQTIGVAQGMLMQRFGLTLDQAFEVLRRHSQDQNIKLRDLAEQLVTAGRIGEGLEAILNRSDADSGRPRERLSQ